MIEEPADTEIDGNVADDGAGADTQSYDTPFLVAALLVYVAKGDGTISEKETEKMLALLEQHFRLQSAAALALLTRAMAALSDMPDLQNLLRQLSSALNDQDKEDIAVMLLQVVAADGHRDAAEMEKMDVAAEVVDISPEVMHRAFGRYFDEAPE